MQLIRTGAGGEHNPFAPLTIRHAHHLETVGDLQGLLDDEGTRGDEEQLPCTNGSIVRVGLEKGLRVHGLHVLHHRLLGDDADLQDQLPWQSHTRNGTRRTRLV